MTTGPVPTALSLRASPGFAWIEEVLAGVSRKVPYNAEAEMKRRGALYERGLLPFASKVVVDGRLVTGQNPRSARATAERLATLLEGIEPAPLASA